MNTSKRAALACAFLASTALASPAFAQSEPPPKFQSIDENGVDLVSGRLFFSVTEGSIGAGEGALSLIRHWAGAAGWRSNWGGAIYRRSNGSESIFHVELGTVSDTFQVSGTSFVAEKADGSKLENISGGYRYTAADGTRVEYSTTSLMGYPYEGGYCSTGDKGTCGIPISVTKPNGMTFTLDWDVVEVCEGGLTPELDCASGAAYFRLKRVTSSANYTFAMLYATDDPGSSSSAPQTSWFTTTGAQFNNLASPPAALPTVTYAYPASNVIDVTDTGGRNWRFTNASGGKPTGMRRPGAASDTTTIAYDSNTGLVSSVTNHGVTTNYARSVSGSTATVTITNALSQQSVVTSDLSIGRTTSVKDPLNRTTSFNYDPNGRLTRTTSPDSNYVELSYDARGNVTRTDAVPKPSVGGATITTFASFDASCANVVKCNKPNSTTDARGNVTDYAYDPTHGGLLSITAPAGPNGVRPQTLGFSYNPASQITSNSRSNDGYAWTAHYNVNRPYASNGLNQYTQTGSIVPTYDAKGNLTSAGSGSYGYTAENRLATAPASNFAYDPVGRLFYISSGQHILDYDGSDLIVELDSATGREVRRRYVHGPGTDEALVWYEGAGTGDRRWLHADERGSIVAVTDAAGNAIAINRYDEYGILNAHTGSIV